MYLPDIFPPPLVLCFPRHGRHGRRRPLTGADEPEPLLLFLGHQEDRSRPMEHPHPLSSALVPRGARSAVNRRGRRRGPMREELRPLPCRPRGPPRRATPWGPLRRPRPGRGWPEPPGTGAGVERPSLPSPLLREREEEDDPAGRAHLAVTRPPGPHCLSGGAPAISASPARKRPPENTPSASPPRLHGWCQWAGPHAILRPERSGG